MSDKFHKIQCTPLHVFTHGTSSNHRDEPKIFFYDAKQETAGELTVKLNKINVPLPYVVELKQNPSAQISPQSLDLLHYKTSV